MGEWHSPSSVHDKCCASGNYPAPNFIDGNTGTLWIGNGDPKHMHWIEMDLGGSFNVQKVRIYSCTNTRCDWDHVDVYVGEPGNWTKVKNNWYIPAESGWHEIDVTDYVGTHIRLEDIYSAAYRDIYGYEFEFYGEPVDPGGWLSPTGGSGWDDSSNAYDDNTGSSAYVYVYGNSWSDWLNLTISAIQCNKVRVYPHLTRSHRVEVYRDGSWVEVHNGNLTGGQWNEIEFDQGEVTEARVRVYNGGGTATYMHLYEFDFWEVPSWWDTDWQQRFIYEIPNENLPDGEDLDEFPLHIDLGEDAPAAFWQNVKSDGSDIRVVDSDGNQLTGCHLEGWDYANQKGHLWVKKTVVQDDGTDNVDFVYVYYGNDGASADWDKAGTYDSGFKGVYHLDETSGHHLDATSNDNDSSSETVTQQGADIGQIDGADEFDGQDDYIDLGKPAGLQLRNNFTLEFWVKLFATTHEHCLAWWDAWADNRGWRVLVDGGDFDFGTSETGDAHDHLYSGLTLNTDQWYHVVVTFEDGEKKIYVDGDLKNSTTESYTQVADVSSEIIAIGASSTPDGYGEEYLDEVRISGAVRSPEWVEFAYLSDKGDAGTAGAQESLEVLSEAVSAGVDDACDDLTKAYCAFGEVSAGVDDASDFPLAEEEEPTPYAFIF